jgi:hypothetical protein
MSKKLVVLMCTRSNYVLNMCSKCKRSEATDSESGSISRYCSFIFVLYSHLHLASSHLHLRKVKPIVQNHPLQRAADVPYYFPSWVMGNQLLGVLAVNVQRLHVSPILTAKDAHLERLPPTAREGTLEVIALHESWSRTSVLLLRDSRAPIE